MTETAQKLRHVMPAPFVELGEKIARLAGKEDDIIDLTQGISRIQLTEDVVDRISGQIGMVEASRYSSDQGLPGLREQVARRVGEKGQIGPDSVIVTPGANQATFIALSAILEQRDGSSDHRGHTQGSPVAKGKRAV
jgi:aspartate/methionine/tyrosine aminotransferase